MKNDEALQRIDDRLKSIDKSLKVILACVLLPKGGPNWAFYESLFRFAEENMKRGLTREVEDILSSKDCGC